MLVISPKVFLLAKSEESCSKETFLNIILATFINYIKFLTFFRVCHKGVNAGEIVGVKIVFVELALYWIVKLWEVILSN